MSTESRALRLHALESSQASWFIPRWVSLAALFLVVSVIESIGIGHLFAFLPLRLREIGVAEPGMARLTGMLCGTMFLLGLPLVPLWGVWADRYGRKPVIVRSAWVQALVFTGIAIASSPSHLFGAMLLAGLQLGNTGLMLGALRQAAPRGRVGLALSLVNLGTPIGTALGPALGGWVMDSSGLTLSGLFAIDAVLSVVAGLMLCLCYREAQRPAAGGGTAVQDALRSVAEVAREPIARTLLVMLSLFLIGRNMVNPFIALLVERVHGSGPGLASAVGVVVGTASLIGALVSPIAAALGDRYGHRRVLAAALVTASLALPAIACAADQRMLALACAGFSAAFATIVSLVYALLAVDVPQRIRSVALSLAFVPFYVGALVGPNLSALLMSPGLDDALSPLGPDRLGRPFPIAVILVVLALGFARRLPAAESSSASGCDQPALTLVEASGPRSSSVPRP